MSQMSNKLLKNKLKIDFFCRNQKTSKEVDIDSPKNERDDMLEYLAIKNGKILKDVKMQKPTKYFLEYMFNDFDITEHLEKKYPESKYESNFSDSEHSQILSFIQIAKKLKKNPSKGTAIPLINIKEVDKIEKSKEEGKDRLF